MLVLIVVVVIVMCILYFGSGFIREEAQKETVTVGLSKGQMDSFQKDMQIAGKQYAFIKKGNYYLENGETDKAIEEYEKAVKNAYSNVTLSEAQIYLVGGYEKKREYGKALKLLNEVVQKYVISPKDPHRIPEEERIKYLKYFTIL